MKTTVSSRAFLLLQCLNTFVSLYESRFNFNTFAVWSTYTDWSLEDATYTAVVSNSIPRGPQLSTVFSPTLIEHLVG